MPLAPAPQVEAKVTYMATDFRVIKPGTFVRCGVSGKPIQLDELKYWSVERQEAYASVQESLVRITGTQGL